MVNGIIRFNLKLHKLLFHKSLVYRFQNNRPYPAFVPSPTERSPPSPHPAREGARAVPGLISGDEPRLVLLQDLPLEWTVGISPRGGGDRGGGTPLPGQNVTQQFLSGKPHPARPPASFPALGAGAVMAIAGRKPCPGSGADAGFPGERESGPESGSSPGSPRALDHGGYRHGGGAVRGDTGDKPSPGMQTPG